MKTRRLSVHHEPIGQPRHRVSTTGGFAKMYLPAQHPVHEFKRSIRVAFGPRKMASGPVAVMLSLFFPRPKAKIWKRRKMERYAHTGKPDIDNVTKAIFDALNKWAWQDDSQIWSVIVSKWVCGGDEQPRVEISITSEDEAE